MRRCCQKIVVLREDVGVLESQSLSEEIIGFFQNSMPFGQLVGLDINRLECGKVEIVVAWNDQLMGNPFHKILHGGVTATMLDTVGGLTAILYAVNNKDFSSKDDFLSKLRNLGTIDMRVDYLRPGKGKQFIATAEVIRKGNKVAVCRMELHNEEGTHIAFGTGTYLVG